MTPVEPGVKVPDGNVANDASVTPDDGTKVSSSARKRSRKRQPDSPPQSRPKRPGAEERTFTTSELEEALAQILTFPAIPCAMTGDEWAVNHFTESGRVFAKNLAASAERNPAIRKWAVRIAQGEAVGTLAFSAIMYAVPPLIHWGVIPVPAEAKAMMGIPSAPTVVGDPEQTAAQHMADHVPGNVDNGNNAGETHRRHTP